MPLIVLPPALIAIGVALLPLPGAWTPAHLIFLAGVLTVPATAYVLARHAPGPPLLRRAGLGLAIGGALALAGQLFIDVIVWQLAAGDRAAARPLFRSLQADPVIDIGLYSVGPALLFVGFAAIGIALGRLAGWTLVAGTLVMGAARVIDVHLVELVGLALILAGVAIAAATAPTRSASRQPVTTRQG